MIRAENIVKQYDVSAAGAPALRGVSLEIKDGEFVAIMGRSGSGKSTLLYQLSMLDRPTEGRVWFRGAEMTALPERDRTAIRLAYMGYIFQDYALLPTLSALENVTVPLLMRGTPRRRATAEAREALAAFGLGEKMSHLPNRLSGGEQQRISIARAVAHRPDVLFADEPTANLDTRTSKLVLDHFTRLHKTGQTIVMVTHEPDYASIASRVVTLADGAVVSDEPHSAKAPRGYPPLSSRRQAAGLRAEGDKKKRP